MVVVKFLQDVGEYKKDSIYDIDSSTAKGYHQAKLISYLTSKEGVFVYMLQDVDEWAEGSIIDMDKDMADNMAAEKKVKILESIEEGDSKQEFPISEPDDFIVKYDLGTWTIKKRKEKSLKTEDISPKDWYHFLQEDIGKEPNITKESVKEYFKLFVRDPDTILVTEEYVGTLSKEQVQEITLAVKKNIKTLEKKNKESKKSLYFTSHRLNMDMVTTISRDLSREFKYPILVLPNGEISHNTLITNDYCKFKARVISAQSSTKEEWTIGRIVELKDGRKTVYFPDEKSPEGSIEYTRDSFDLKRFSYACLYEDSKIIILSENMLELGREYIFTGLVFKVEKFELKGQRTLTKQTICVAQKIQPAIDERELPAEILQKCKGKTLSWFVRSVSYPVTLVPTYGTLITTNWFGVRTGFPNNHMYIGDAGISKTFMLNKAAAVFKTVKVSGNSTIKNFIPSFASQNPDPGMLFKTDTKVLVDEFFLIVSKTAVTKEQAYDQLSKLKDSFEGMETEFGSGIGSMRVKMIADFVGGSNFPSKPGGGQFTSVLDMYDFYDPAFMDRVLFFEVPKEQAKIRIRDQTKIDTLMSQVKNDFKKLDYKGLLTPEEIYRIHLFTRNKSHMINPELIDQYSEQYQEIFLDKIPKNLLSRGQKFFYHMCCSFANIRYLIEGRYSDPDASIVIEKEDIALAAKLFTEVIDTYGGSDKVSSYHKEVSTLTAIQDEVLGVIRQIWETGIKHSREADYNNLFERMNLPEDQFKKVIDILEEKGLILRSGRKVMWFPRIKMSFDLHRFWLAVNEASWDPHKEVIEKEKDFCKILSAWHLMSWSQERGWYSLWDKNSQSLFDQIYDYLSSKGEVTQREFLEKFGPKGYEIADRNNLFRAEGDNFKFLGTNYLQKEGPVDVDRVVEEKFVKDEMDELDEIIKDEPVVEKKKEGRVNLIIEDLIVWIRNNDPGDGVDMVHLMDEWKGSHISEDLIEKTVQNLINKGDLFSPKPGKVKVLE